MFQLIQKMLDYLKDNPLAKIGVMFDDTGNKHCVYITYITYTDDEESIERQLDDEEPPELESLSAVAGSFFEQSPRKTKVERLLLTMAAPLMDKSAKNAGTLNVWLMEHFGIPLDRIAGSVSDHAALGNA